MKTTYLLLLLFFTGICFGQEICDNGIDDDGDGRIDLNDPDCRCGNQTPVPSIIPNASFEDYTACPSNFSQLNNCSGWVQATEATSDYMNTCGMVFSAVEDLSATLMPFPDGQGISGAIFDPTWNEYLGSCLTAPMLKDTVYQVTFDIASLPVSGQGGTCNSSIIDYDPVNVTIYGTQNCINLPLYTVISPSRASTEWVELGRAVYVPQSRWGQLTITFTPQNDIKAIMIGAPPDLPPSYSASSCLPYFLFDNLTLNQSSQFDVNINATGDYCDGDLTLAAALSVTVSANATYQWYKEGIAVAGATQDTYIIISGSDNLAQYCVRVTDGDDCYVSPNYTINTSSPAPDIAITQPNCIADGKIIVNTPSALYSFDNGASWQASNDSGPLQEGTFVVKTRTATGCTSLGSVARLSYANISQIDFTFVNPLCGVKGSITITSPGFQYSFDGGSTWQAENTKELDHGSYNIKISDSLGCVAGENYVYLAQPFLNQPLVSKYDVTCASGGIITINTPADFYSIDDGTTWSTTNTFDSLTEGYYYVKIKDATGCESNQMYVYIGYEVIYPPVTENNVSYCQYTTPTALTATGTDILWYDTAVGGTPLSEAPTPNTDVIGEVWYYATQTVRGCESRRVSIKVTVKLKPDLATATQFYEFCQDLPTTTLTANGTGLRWYTTPVAGFGSTIAPVPPSNVPGIFYYYVCQSFNGCEGDRIPIEVIIHPTPVVPVTEDELFYKQYTPTTVLKAIGERLTWYNEAFDALPHQPIITTKELGQSIYYVSQTINNCEGVLQKITVNIIPNPITIKYPLYFTPNGDNTHEAWNIHTPDFGIKATIFIFDRHGKLIKQLFSPGQGWDGTFNGRNLPASDYWFTATYTEYGETKQFKSHFSLIR